MDCTLLICFLGLGRMLNIWGVEMNEEQKAIAFKKAVSYVKTMDEKKMIIVLSAFMCEAAERDGMSIEEFVGHIEVGFNELLEEVKKGEDHDRQSGVAPEVGTTGKSRGK